MYEEFVIHSYMDMVEVSAALSRKGSQEVAEHSLVIVLRLAFVAVILTRVGGGGGFYEFSSSAPDIFSSCLIIPRAHFESSSVMVSFNGYQINDIISSRWSSHF